MLKCGATTKQRNSSVARQGQRSTSNKRTSQLNMNKLRQLDRNNITKNNTNTTNTNNNDQNQRVVLVKEHASLDLNSPVAKIAHQGSSSDR